MNSQGQLHKGLRQRLRPTFQSDASMASQMRNGGESDGVEVNDADSATHETPPRSGFWQEQTPLA
jgi:hypothetical protein